MEPSSIHDKPGARAGSLDNPEVVENVPGHVIPILQREFDDFDTEATRFLEGSLTDPGQLCVVIDVLANKVVGGLLGSGLLGGLTDTIVNTCQSLVKRSPDLLKLLDDSGVLKIVNGIINGLGALSGNPVVGG